MLASKLRLIQGQRRSPLEDQRSLKELVFLKKKLPPLLRPEQNFFAKLAGLPLAATHWFKCGKRGMCFHVRVPALDISAEQEGSWLEADLFSLNMRQMVFAGLLDKPTEAAKVPLTSVMRMPQEEILRQTLVTDRVVAILKWLEDETVSDPSKQKLTKKLAWLCQNVGRANFCRDCSNLIKREVFVRFGPWVQTCMWCTLESWVKA